MRISYAVTVSSEVQELMRLLNTLSALKRPEDEIILLIDKTKEYVDEIKKACKNYPISCTVEDAFNGDFSEWKNKLRKISNGDWIFQIDADEVPTEELIDDLPALLEANSSTALILVPRENIVNGITPEHIRRWNWNDAEEGINWPDYQTRIYRNVEGVQWKGKVHERIVVEPGIGTINYIPYKTHRLIHIKSIETQVKQNKLYDRLQSES